MKTTGEIWEGELLDELKQKAISIRTKLDWEVFRPLERYALLRNVGDDGIIQPKTRQHWLKYRGCGKLFPEKLVPYGLVCQNDNLGRNQLIRWHNAIDLHL